MGIFGPGSRGDRRPNICLISSRAIRILILHDGYLAERQGPRIPRLLFWTGCWYLSRTPLVMMGLLHGRRRKSQSITYSNGRKGEFKIAQRMDSAGYSIAWRPWFGD